MTRALDLIAEELKQYTDLSREAAVAVYEALSSAGVISQEPAAMNEAPKWSAEWVRNEVVARKATHLENHACSLCGYMTSYLFRGGYTEVYFDPGCYCTRGDGLRPTSFADVADWLAMQSSDEIRERIWSGLRPLPPPPSQEG